MIVKGKVEEKLEKLKTLLGVGSKAEVIKLAVTNLLYFEEEKLENNAEIILRYPNGTEKRVLKIR